MLRANHFGEATCYTNRANRKWIATVLLGQAYGIFSGTSLVHKLDTLSQISFCRPIGIRMHKVIWALDPAVIDSLRIATCFENLFKARLILGGYVVHRINKQHLPDTGRHLVKAQTTRPITVREIKALEGLLGQRGHDYGFKTLGDHTIGWRTLANEAGYRRALGLPDRLFESLAAIVRSRNNAHFLAAATTSYSTEFIGDLLFIRCCFNKYVVRAHNRLVRQRGLPDVHLRRELGTS